MVHVGCALAHGAPSQGRMWVVRTTVHLEIASRGDGQLRSQDRPLLIVGFVVQLDRIWSQAMLDSRSVAAYFPIAAQRQLEAGGGVTLTSDLFPHKTQNVRTR